MNLTNIKWGHNHNDFISLDEESHIYSGIDGNIYKSVSKVYEPFVPNPDFSVIAMNIARGMVKRNPRLNILACQKKILADWDLNGTESADRGTKIHKILEDYVISGYRDDRFKEVYLFLDNLFAKYARINPELIVFDPDTLVAGTGDVMCDRFSSSRTKPENRIVDYYDYKTFAKMSMDSYSEKSGKFRNDFFYSPFEYMENTKYNKIALQLNIYAYIGLKVFGVIPGRLGIIWVKELDDGTFIAEMIPILYMPHIGEQILAHRKEFLNNIQHNKKNKPEIVKAVSTISNDDDWNF